MSMNKFMHPRNIYREKPDFLALVKLYPELTKVTYVDMSGRLKLNYKDVTALQLLTCCLLRRDFGLEIELPPDKLIPTLPLRLNYILWLEDIEGTFGWKNRSAVRGLDIGCGASCIYPLLATVQSKHRWKMVGLERSNDSVECARKNVTRNGLGDEIKIVQQDNSEKTILKAFMASQMERFDFCMCNPPFFDDGVETKMENRTGRRKEPSNAKTGSSAELSTDGGEVRFVGQIIEESMELRDRIHVYTSMIGHKRNYEELLRMLKGHGINNMTTTRFCQGNTTRWGIAWSFSSDIVLSKVANHITSVKQKSPDKPLGIKLFTEENVPSLEEAQCKVMRVLSPLNLGVRVLEGTDQEMMWELSAQENTWSHQRRKRREAQRKLSPGGENSRNKLREESEIVETNESPCKRSKTNHGDPDEPILKGVLCLKRLPGDGYYLALSYTSGSAGKDATNQILQYIKNTLKI
ncbi:U6 small nuclear RNA (adenine-(43)-N(6))-methyltransferase [Toxorhynchites rutilus septentrionalis]|uniref:U6 small nuclear RNA (adenine-(43)-N(6))-methyltransferase n=1 Tax=Toxorhynchites rutilus septentrionalis TaxID=329112 RepID=UPI002478F711|nr:U6 small nuclear RNA (adenine-(43)-N(6))-methyltransferase [Toxorhynchites rutilus septentrionalis]